MQVTTIFYIVLSIILNSLGQLFLKAGTNRLGVLQLNIADLWHTLGHILIQLPIIGGLLCYIISITIWIIALSRVDVMIAYPLLSLGYVINAIGAWYFLDEIMNWQRLLGISIIMLGVFLLIRNTA